MSFRDELRATQAQPGGGENDDVARMLRALNDGSRVSDHRALNDPFDEGNDQRGFTGFVASLLLTLIVLGAGLATVYAAYGESVFATVASWFSGDSRAPVTAPAPAPRRGDTPPEGLIARPTAPVTPTPTPVAPTPAPVAAAATTPASAAQAPTPVAPAPVEAPKPTTSAPVAPAPATETPHPAASAPQPEPAPQPVAAPAKPAPTVEPAPAPTVTEPAKAAKPAASATTEKPAAEKPAPAGTDTVKPLVAPSTAGRFAIQVGTFSVPANADDLKKKIEAKGLPVMIVNWTDKAGKAWRAVRVGPYKTDGEARKAAEDLRGGGLNLSPQVIAVH